MVCPHGVTNCMIRVWNVLYVLCRIHGLPDWIGVDLSLLLEILADQ